jgi:hypothetical protein
MRAEQEQRQEGTTKKAENLIKLLYDCGFFFCSLVYKMYPTERAK